MANRSLCLAPVLQQHKLEGPKKRGQIVGSRGQTVQQGLPCQAGRKLEWRPCWVVERAEGQAGVKFQKPRDKQCEAMANWDGARITLDVEKRPEAQASVEIELEGWVFPKFTQLNLLILDSKSF